MKSLTRLIFLFISVQMSACASVSSVSLTPIPPQAERNQPVEVTVSKFIFLAFNFNNDYLDEIVPKLREKCPNGKITGILTKHAIYSYVLAHTVEIHAKGFCVAQKT